RQLRTARFRALMGAWSMVRIRISPTCSTPTVPAPDVATAVNNSSIGVHWFGRGTQAGTTSSKVRDDIARAGRHHHVIDAMPRGTHGLCRGGNQYFIDPRRRHEFDACARSYHRIT